MLAKISSTQKWEKTPTDDYDKLWMEIRSAKKESLSRLFCLTYSWLFNYGYKIIPNEAFIKDAIQELFLNLWKKRECINEARSVKSYLLYSLRRLILRRLKKQRNRTIRNHDYKDQFSETILTVEDLIVHFEMEQEKKEKLATAIGSLSSRQKEAIYLKFYEGLSASEMASVMGINKQSVYNHVSKAIDKLQEFIVT